MRMSMIALIFIMMVSGAALSLASGCASREGAQTEQQGQGKKNPNKAHEDNMTKRPGGPSDPYGPGGSYGNPSSTRRTR